MKFIITLFFLFFLCNSTYSQTQKEINLGKAYIFFLNSPIGYQAGYDTKSKSLINSFDVNASLLFFNAGYNYNGQWGSTLFVGIGAGAPLQLQYGRNFQDNYNLIRIRSDFSLYILKNVKYKSKWRFFTIGGFWDYSFDAPEREHSFGLTVGFNLAGFLI